MALMLVAAILLGTVNERTIGTVTDEQVMLSTAFAIGSYGELGVARGQIITTMRESGDAVAPYGLAWPALMAPFLRACAPFERAFGSRASQSLLTLLPIALIVLACAGSGLLARELGASPFAQALAVLGTGLGSPLWAYASTLFSEPLQAALLVFALLCAVRRQGARAGLLLGLVVLAKSVSIGLAPCLLLPLAWPVNGERWFARGVMLPLARAAAAAALPLGAWLALDIHRFGAPLSGYTGQHFSHPALDGLWRLLVGANEGLLVFFPLLILSLVGLGLLASSRRLRPAALAMTATCGGLLMLYSAWWAWDGSSGWGPRLLVPIIPLLAAAAAIASDARAIPRFAGPALLVLGVVVNALGIAQSDIGASAYVDSCGPVIVPEAEVPWYPEGLAASAPVGQRRVSRTMAAARDAAFAPVSTHSYLIATRLLPEEERALALETPPWIGTHPDAVPRLAGIDGELSGVMLREVSSALRWPHWGAALTADSATRSVEFHGAWRDTAIDQTLRALDMHQPERAVRLAREQWDLTPSPFIAALLAAALREAGQTDALGSFLRGLPPSAINSPEMSVVLALIARDRGMDDAARAALRLAEPAIRTAALQRALTAPLADWPTTYRDLTR